VEIRWSDEATIDDVPAWIARLLNEPILEFWCGTRPLRGRERGEAVAEFKQILGYLVGHWLASGRDKNDPEVDVPSSRNITWTSGRYPTPLFKTLRKFWDRYEKKTQAVIDGTRSAPLFFKVGIPDTAASQDPLFAARERAILEFSRLLASGSPERLFCCEGCGKYFSKQRAPRKDTPIFHGSFCGKKACRHSAGAKRTEKKRQRDLNQRLDVAAALWLESGQEKPAKLRSAWIAEQMTRKHLIEIRGKWVTQHSAEIEKRVQEQGNRNG
jgi:hypothetical protein